MNASGVHLLMSIEYKVNQPVLTEQFVALLRESRLADKLPVEDTPYIQGMLKNSNLVVAAWDQNRLIGISRCITDFHYVCYLSDLAVSTDYQYLGVDKTLQSITQQQLGPRCKLILMAAPTAIQYYQPVGYANNPGSWVLNPN